MDWHHREYKLTDDRESADLGVIHGLLNNTYWAAGRTRESIAVSIENSICFSLFARDVQIGVARIITDYATTSYLCDVILHPDHRDRALGSWMMKRIMEHPAVQSTKMLLITRDAQAFYKRLGFKAHPYDCMVKAQS